MTKNSRHHFIFWGICLLSLFMHLSVFQKDLIGFHVWRQTETQTVIQEFMGGESDFFHPHKYDLAETAGLHIREFPLLQYGFAWCSLPFEQPFVISRVLSFVISCFTLYGILLLVGTFSFGKKIQLAAVWLLAFSPVFYYYAVNPMPDNLALCLAVFSLYWSISWQRQKRLGHFILAVYFLSLATLIKLPFVLTGGTLFYFMCADLRQPGNTPKKIVVWFIAVLAGFPPLAWYLYSIPFWNGVGVQQGILDRGISFTESVDIIFHHLVSGLPELFVNYAAMPAFVAGIFFFAKQHYQRKKMVVAEKIPGTTIRRALFFQLALLILFFLFEHNMIGKVHDYYLLPFLPLIVLTSIYGLSRVLNVQKKWVKGIVVAGVVMMPLTAYLRIQTRWNEASPGFSPGFYQYKTEIRKILPTDARCITGEDESGFIQLYYLQRKGWTFKAENFDSAHFYQWRLAGATHFVTDQQNDTVCWVKKNLDEKIFDRDGIRIYTLR